MTSTLQMRLLGDFVLILEDKPVTSVIVPRLQSLLTYLVLHRDSPQDRSHLAFLLWPDSTEAQAHTNLRKLLYQLRQAFPEIDQFLSTDKRCLQWLPAHAAATWTLDITELELALVRAEQAERVQDVTAQCQALEQVLTLYRGDLLPSCYDEWILPERDRWHQIFLSAAERLIALLEQECKYTAAITIAQQLIRQDPLQEATYRQCMRLYALHGDRAAALRVYHSCVTLMERELGAEPSVATRMLYESLMQSDASPEMPTGPLTSRGTTPPLLGRKAEWRQLQELWRKATGKQTGSPHIVLLSGEAGIGKTRLAEELEAWVSRQGMTSASARCYAAQGSLAYAPITTWLRTDALQAGLSDLDPAWLTEIARLVPEILATRPKLSRPAAMTEGWQRRHFFEALARAVLAARQPLLLLLDDLQWCDSETLEWLHYLVRFAPAARLLLIGTVRAEEIASVQALEAFRSALQRDGLLTELALGPLTTDEITSLAEHVVGRPLAPAQANHLYVETEGNPLFAVEMLRAGALEQSEQAGAEKSIPSPLHAVSTLPPTVQSVLATRLAQLSPSAHDVANVAAVIGREFAFSVLAQASGEREEMVVRGLDELWQRRIVREQSMGTAEAYDFSHDKLREQVYISLSPAYRRLLHRRVAEAFSVVYAHDLDAVCGQMAVHYEHAGLPARAIPYYQRVGESASRIYALAEAIYAFKQARALLEKHVSGPTRRDVSWETELQVYEALGDVSAEIGRYEEARSVYHHALTCIPGQDSQSNQNLILQARMHRKVAKTWNFVSTNPHDDFHVNARQAFQQAEDILTHAADPTNPAWRQEWIVLQFDQIWPIRGSVDAMDAVIEKARPIIEQYGTQEQRKNLVDAIGMSKAVRARYIVPEEVITSRRVALAELQQNGNKGQIGTAHMALGITLLWAGQLDEAEEQLKIALGIAEETGIAWMQSRCLTFLPFIFRFRGQVEQVRTMLARAQAAGVMQNNSNLTAQRAWLAWRDGNLIEAESAGRASVEEGQRARMEFNPLQWAALWPLIGVALAREQMPAAIEYVRALFDPTQQPPPEQLNVSLEAALQAWDAGEQATAHTQLQQAVSQAQALGYL